MSENAIDLKNRNIKDSDNIFNQLANVEDLSEVIIFIKQNI